MHALEQALEAGESVLIERHDLAVEHDAVGGECPHRALHLGIGGRGVPPGAVGERHVAASLVGHDAHAVQLQLEDVARSGHDAVLGGTAEHGRQLAAVDVAPRRAERLGPRLGGLGDVVGALQLIDGQARQHRARLRLADVLGRLALGVDVLLLDEEPVSPPGALLEAHEREPTTKLVSCKYKIQLSVLGALLGAGLEVPNLPAIPADHRTRAVAPLGDDALEVHVLERVILGLHGEALLLWIQGGTVRHGEAREYTAALDAEIVVASRGVVQVHHERAVARLGGRVGAGLARRLARDAEIALFAIGRQLVLRPGHVVIVE